MEVCCNPWASLMQNGFCNPVFYIVNYQESHALGSFIIMAHIHTWAYTHTLFKKKFANRLQWELCADLSKVLKQFLVTCEELSVVLQS